MSEAEQAPVEKTEGNDYDYLVQEPDKQVLGNLTKMGEHLKTLKTTMLTKELEFDQAKKEYDYYASTILAAEMMSAGISELSLMSGGKISYNRKFYCQPNKNAEDRTKLAEWLRQQQGAHLVKATAMVDSKDLAKLQEASIPFVEADEVNTNALKAFLKDKVQSGMPIGDIPAYIHFQEVGTVEIE